VSNITHFASERCPITQLTKLQIWALASTCIEVSRQIPNGVYRSLVIRGLLTSTHMLTADGREALANCTVLSNQVRRSLLAMPIFQASRGPTRKAIEKSPRYPDPRLRGDARGRDAGHSPRAGGGE
jgi:hypothetical protein